MTVTAEPVHAESARYSASVLCLPGLWSGPAVWRGFAGYLGHRGWESYLLDVRGIPGGTTVRAAAVGNYAGELGSPPVLLGHDAGALLAIAVAARERPAAVVMVGPLVPGSPGVRRLVLAPRSIVALLTGQRVPPPTAATAAAWLDLPEPARSATHVTLESDHATAVRDVVWGRVAVTGVPGVPVLLVVGGLDPIVDRREAERLARASGAELRIVDGAGHWLLGGPCWQEVAALVHRWLV